MSAQRPDQAAVAESGLVSADATRGVARAASPRVSLSGGHDLIVELASAVQAKRGQHLAGDVVVSQRLQDERRAVAVLSDGLGSGVRANVLANLTATMALAYARDQRNPIEAAEVILRSLPVDPVRGIAYATFTILDVSDDGRATVVEYGNPQTVLLPVSGAPQPLDTTLLREGLPGRQLLACDLVLAPGERLVAISDGITQAGMGRPATPFGWGNDGLCAFLDQPGSRLRDARGLSHAVLEAALACDGGVARDDVSAVVCGVRVPRELLVVTGPPYAIDRDRELSERAAAFRGAKAVCGGSTASILARELELPLQLDLNALDSEIPPTSRLDGFDLVSEGTITLAAVLDRLELGRRFDRRHGAGRLLDLLLTSDRIRFWVGTRINEAHQDPSLPENLAIRRNMVRRMAHLLETRYGKAVEVELW